MTCGIWKRSLLPSGFISLFQPLRLQDGSQLLVPCSRASWTGGAHRDPPERAKGLCRVLARESSLWPRSFSHMPEESEGVGSRENEVSSWATLAWVWSAWEGERQTHGLSIFLRVSSSVQREGGLKGSGERAETTERGKDVGEERGLGDHSRQDPELSLRTLDRTWGLLVFYSFLFAQVGAQAWLLTLHLCLSGLVLDFISRCEAAVPLARSTGMGTVCSRPWHC